MTPAYPGATAPTPRGAAARERGARASRRSRDRPGPARARPRRAPRPAGGQGGDEELVRLARERERARLAAGADDAARARRERREVLTLAARRAGRQLGREARGEQQLEPEGERVRACGRRRVAVEQLELPGRAGCRPACSAPRSRAASARRRTPGWPGRASGQLSRSAGCASTVSTPVTVQRSPRPWRRIRFTRASGSSRPPSRDFTRRAPFAIAPIRPRSRLYRWRMRSASP